MSDNRFDYFYNSNGWGTSSKPAPQPVLQSNIRPQHKANLMFLLILCFLYAGTVLLTAAAMFVDISDPIVFYTAEGILELAVMLGAIAIVRAPKTIRFSTYYRLNRPSAGEIFIPILMTVPVILASNSIAYFWQYVLGLIGTLPETEMATIDSLPVLLIAIVGICVVPAIFEELAARGAIMRGYEKKGPVAAIIISGLFFAMMHLSIETVVPIFVIGCVLGYVAWITNSIWSSVIIHFLNNLYSIALLYFSNFSEELSALMNEEAGMTTETVIMELGLLIFSIGAIMLLGFWLSRVSKRHDGNRSLPQLEQVNETKCSGPLIWALIIIGITYAASIALMLVDLTGLLGL